MFFSILLFWICICFIIFQLKPKRPKNFPPGPPTFPILGNLLSLSLENPLGDFERLRKSYGNVYSLYLGLNPAIIINGLNAIKEAIVTKGHDFAGRPQDLFVNHITESKGVILADYGQSWKEHRRFALMTLRNFGMGKNSMENRIHGEIKFIIKSLERSIGDTLSPQVMFHNASSNIICQVLFGTRFDYDDTFIKTVVQCFTENAKLASGPWSMLYDSLPIIRSLPLPFKKAFKNVQIVQALVHPILAEHKETRVPGEPRDFLDCYLDEMDKRKDDSNFSEDKLIMYSLDLYFAGTDTTSNTLLTGFFYLMNYPEIQESSSEFVLLCICSVAARSLRRNSACQSPMALLGSKFMMSGEPSWTSAVGAGMLRRASKRWRMSGHSWRSILLTAGQFLPKDPFCWYSQDLRNVH
ncbi:cytochrome P450 2F2-like isoform X2 [Gouania willdenowi]|uniref:cytochrome P450 2F2-like isoform X2 n=1 Tax=Gouania willdenowi TaxID=441366 RepID=UPI001055EB9F|nr:cytochrome P450 2F2-like isoform X2 [Gouania willdenowi]